MPRAAAFVRRWLERRRCPLAGADRQDRWLGVADWQESLSPTCTCGRC